MKALFKRICYLPILKWKQGEYTALGTLPPNDQDLICPLMVVPPAGDFDHETGRVLEPAEHIKRFGARVFSHWGQRPMFVDALHVDDERHRGESTVHPLTALLARARLSGAQISPATALRRSPDYQAAVARFVELNPEAVICVRINAGEFESDGLAEDLDALCAVLKCPPENIVLVVDFAGDEPPADDDFIEALSNRFNHLPNLHKWLQVVIALTSFPEKIKAPAGECSRFPRTDWEIFSRLIASGERLLRRPIFGDYALEFPNYAVVGMVIPRARLRYSTPVEYVVESGTTTKKPFGYAAIFLVADALTSKSDYAGRFYSNGDAFIDDLSKRVRGPGNAWKWRWATTEHHLRLVLRGLREMFGIEEAEVLPLVEPEQVELF